MQPTLNKGDRVRVVLEGTVAGSENDFYYTGLSHGEGGLYLYGRKATSVEVIKPAKFQYKHGDVVRNKNSQSLYLIADNGNFISLQDGTDLEINAFDHLDQHPRQHELVYRQAN